MSAVMDNALHGDAKSFDTMRKLGALDSVLSGNDVTGSVLAADKILFTMRESAAVAEGKRSEQDAVENLIDRVAVHVTTWAQQCCIRVCEQTGGKIGEAIGGIFGPGAAAVGAKVGKFLGHCVGVALKPVVENGVQILAEAAKGVWGSIKELGGGICSGISNAVSAVAGWFGF